MLDWLHIPFPPAPLFFAQLLVGLINGAFYAMLSLGLAVIFGLLNIINFTHGAQYMLGAFCAWFLLNYLGLGYWWALIIAPLAVGILGAVIERVLLRQIRGLDHIYGLLLTFGLALVIQGVFRNNLGAYLRAATENATMVQAFGLDVPRMVMLTYAFGAGLAALAGVLAAPIYQVSPLMGADIIIVVFAVVVIGGMGSILGSIVTGFLLGLVEGLTKVVYPEASSTVVFVIMAIVLLVKPAGLFGRAA